MVTSAWSIGNDKATEERGGYSCHDGDRDREPSPVPDATRDGDRDVRWSMTFGTIRPNLGNVEPDSSNDYRLEAEINRWGSLERTYRWIDGVSALLS